jgi:2-furoyl-CoA dehydrogenase FAD binding subunit
MFPWIAHTPIRNRGTVCGSIAHADPSAELVLALVTLGGSIHLASRRSKRTVKAKDFFLGALQTDRRSNELITSVQFSMRAEEAGYGFSEFGYRHGDFAVVAVAAIKESGHWTIGFGGIDDTVKVHRFTAESLDEVYQAIDQLASNIEVREDPTATSGLRRHLMRTLGRSACQQAVEFRKDQVV